MYAKCLLGACISSCSWHVDHLCAIRIGIFSVPHVLVGEVVPRLVEYSSQALFFPVDVDQSQFHILPAYYTPTNLVLVLVLVRLS